MNEHEELLVKALVCLSEALKIQDPGVQAKVLELAYHAQQVAQAAILRDVNGNLPSRTSPK
jgi:hypothetical protein